MHLSERLFSFEKTLKLRKILKDPDNQALSIAKLHEKHQEYSIDTLTRWRRHLQKNPEYMGRFNEKFKTILLFLSAAKASGQNIRDLMAEHPDIARDIWDINQEFKTLEFDGVFRASKAKQIEILNFVKEHSVMDAIREYKDLKLTKRDLSEWNNELNIYNKENPVEPELDDFFVTYVLYRAQDHNELTGTFSGIKEMAKIYHISATTLYKANSICNFVSRRNTMPKTYLSSDTIDQIEFNLEPKTRIVDLTRSMGISEQRIKRALESRGYKCDRYGIHPPMVDEKRNKPNGR